MLEGPINFENFAAMRKAGEALVDGGEGAVSIDLGGLTQANSLAVSAMVAWFRRASRQDKTLTFINVSEPMKKIIRVSGLQDILLGIS